MHARDLAPRCTAALHRYCCVIRETVGLGLLKLTDVAGLARRPSRPEPAPRPTSPTRRLLLFQQKVREVESVVWLHIRCSSCPPPYGW